jgi:hypothetical protein
MTERKSAAACRRSVLEARALFMISWNWFALVALSTRATVRSKPRATPAKASAEVATLWLTLSRRSACWLVNFASRSEMRVRSFTLWRTSRTAVVSKTPRMRWVTSATSPAIRLA